MWNREDRRSNIWFVSRSWDVDLSFIRSYLFGFESRWYPGVLFQWAATIIVWGGVAFRVVMVPRQTAVMVYMTRHVMWLWRTFTVLADFPRKKRREWFFISHSNDHLFFQPINLSQLKKVLKQYVAPVSKFLCCPF